MSTFDTELVDRFEALYGGGRALAHVHAPARSEIAGNHTDHEGGHVVAGALDVSIEGVAALNGTSTVRVASDGYEPFELDLTDLEPRVAEQVSTAGLVRGMAHELRLTGRTPQGFDLVMTSDIPGGSGLSSSAALELAVGRVMETLWEGDPVTPTAMAQAAQRAENVYFGKPCGLMDQLSEALGGIAHIDFADPANPVSEKLDFDFADKGYALCLAYMGTDHSVSTADYAAVPGEMQSVAAEFGCTRLCEVPIEDFDGHVNELRAKLGDRAVLRALHYYIENRLVVERWDALCAGDIDTFLDLTRRSGASSGMYLQNVANGGTDQPAMVALALAERLLGDEGAVRIHGGGFGGSIQAFVPLDRVDSFIAGMDGWLGEGNCRSYRISNEGAYAQWL
ncbi:galactokinase [Candidatus Collinsella stercoripullorum]|uniref:galactokinase n=1 Tax=Candidatus Collinsella stercoripullorum TaxID=2838522 RepID=UPI0022E86C47|nr:galactokinase family protein [Candidatus Collinsella stercoripullorum]